MYVLEGKAPELKAQTMKKRREAQQSQKRAHSENETTTKQVVDTSRSRYNYIQKECRELMDALGVTTITSYGEAEAGCATLNQLGIVDGCITVDGDVFLYGAKKVYRNLSTDMSSFVCQEFLVSKIESSLNLSRDKMIVMAIIFGCDYLPEGLHSVNRECIVKLLSSWPNGQAVNVLKEWMETEITGEAPPPRPTHCSICKHPGSLRGHAKSGCDHCNSTSGCKDSNKPCECPWHKNELRYEEFNLRSKLRSLDSATVLEIFKEFQKEPPEEWRSLTIPSWRMPSVSKFVEISTKKLKWELNYAVSKILPLLTRWVAIHGRQILDKGELDLFPCRVIKKRVKRGCPMYEVEWKFRKEMVGFPTEYVSLEPQFLIEQNHPDLIPQPPSKPVKTKAVRRRKNAKAEECDAGAVRSNDIAEMLARMAISKAKAVTIEVPVSEEALEYRLDESPQAFETDENLSILASDDDVSDLSDIVELICNRRHCPIVAEQQSAALQECQLSFRQQDLAVSAVGKKENVEIREQRAKPAAKEIKSNFSFDFTLSELLVSRNSTVRGRTESELKEGQSQNTTPRKDFTDVSDHSDVFCTPKPLAERLNYFA